ncbi:Replication factor A C-terminal domain-containing protein [Plasmodiophora brassicae]
MSPFCLVTVLRVLDGPAAYGACPQCWRKVVATSCRHCGCRGQPLQRYRVRLLLSEATSSRARIATVFGSVASGSSCPSADYFKGRVFRATFKSRSIVYSKLSDLPDPIVAVEFQPIPEPVLPDNSSPLEEVGSPPCQKRADDKWVLTPRPELLTPLREPDRSIESQMSQLFFSPEISSCSGDMETQAASMVRELHESSDNDNRTGLLGLPEPMSNNNEIDAICRKIQFL